jgi:hypothetical protein
MTYIRATQRMPPPGDTFRVLLITYDLKTAGWNYDPFFSALKNQGNWLHYITSTWLIYTTSTPEGVYAAISPHLSDKDFVLILPVNKPAFGLLPQDAWDWIQQYVP